ncbi:helix-turn-helix domain-containing protein [Agrococcus sp. ARC_14]|uniref:helix-turn-helix domain-containing protein n=1 Tax=Agrococcus sp. ARC_14 TaxID=2919927 RepID=UPI001F064AB5|nr:helix-turn-helix domain-containing protein [Agrococcus sp. ARC_14]MCH1881329.1 helix-turn-helix domain-containing protein [Agrococcus sp. ARC_14]
MSTLRELRQQRGMSLGDVAHRLGVTRATVQDYERTDERGSIRTTTKQRALAALGVIERRPTPDQARSLLMHTIVASKLLTEPEKVLETAKRNLERWADDGRHDEYWLRRWSRVLEHSPADIAMLITERSQDASDMRQGTPFAGVLDVDERTAAIERARELDIALAA